jgi:nucleoside 2-deoxyribosyltransferase
MLWGDDCPIWKTSAKIESADGADRKRVVSRRAGGAYEITRQAEVNLQSIDAQGRARLTTWLVDQRRLGDHSPQITLNTLAQLNATPPLSVHERAIRLLSYLERVQEFVGAKISIDMEDQLGGLSESGEDFAAHCESVNPSELSFLTDQLALEGFITKSGNTLTGPLCQITMDGYRYIAEHSSKAQSSKNAFVAMWFGAGMRRIYEEAIEPGILDAGYLAVRIDRKEHNNKIDDEIVAEIRRARFVIADFTHGTDGMRGGVYYEAGFARGLGLQVISTCDQRLLENNEIHFDTRQYNHIGWNINDLASFRAALTNRICATIGDGPLLGV